MSKDYDVGYGRPPREHQFKPGQSANPKGRPQGSKNVSTILNAALNEKVTTKNAGGSKTMTKARASMTQLGLCQRKMHRLVTSGG